MRSISVRAKASGDQAWVDSFLAERWGTCVVAHGTIFEPALLPALIAGDREGLATFTDGESAELVTLDAVKRGHGVGTALVEALADHLRRKGHRVLFVTTTNDNVNALRFYQRRQFRLIELRSGAVDEARRLKPTIPIVGDSGIPIRDELTLSLDLG